MTDATGTSTRRRGCTKSSLSLVRNTSEVTVLSPLMTSGNLVPDIYLPTSRYHKLILGFSGKVWVAGGAKEVAFVRTC